MCEKDANYTDGQSHPIAHHVSLMFSTMFHTMHMLCYEQLLIYKVANIIIGLISIVDYFSAIQWMINHYGCLINSLKFLLSLCF